ncbi:hypothetical protein DK562_22155 [Salmonella enterica]|nr:hypothetical protein [Salmonella enterica]EBW4446299.1 hypothetical protein [Salmonella enterica subsp. enterica serovar Arechavaleta]ECI4210294.1 hypothetical protein [Salmonella enterica subsp. enterica]
MKLYGKVDVLCRGFSPIIPRCFPVQKTGIKKPAVTGWFFEDFWSAREDLNLRPPTPHVGNKSHE